MDNFSRCVAKGCLRPLGPGPGLVRTEDGGPECKSPINEVLGAGLWMGWFAFQKHALY